jgi:hypothetical protein
MFVLNPALFKRVLYVKKHCIHIYIYTHQCMCIYIYMYTMFFNVQHTCLKSAGFSTNIDHSLFYFIIFYDTISHYIILYSNILHHTISPYTISYDIILCPMFVTIISTWYVRVCSLNPHVFCFIIQDFTEILMVDHQFHCMIVGQTQITYCWI